MPFNLVNNINNKNNINKIKITTKNVGTNRENHFYASTIKTNSAPITRSAF